MKKKAGARALRVGKPRKKGPAGRKPSTGSASPTASRPAPGSERDKETIRRLRSELAGALELVEQLQASAETDFLLGILNRRGFERELTRAIAYIKRYCTNGALIALDVDRLKPINDTFGHGAGDQVLQAIAKVLKAQVRTSDIVGRLGGDEFALLLWNLNETEARAKAAALEQAIDRLAFVFGGSTVSTGASAGVAMLDTRAETGKALEAADGAMYLRKAQRRHER
jgi:diguanylate cyclase (GGDEF)-like protein